MITPGSPEWHALRRTGIGGSDAPGVLGLSPWRTPYAVYADKVGEGQLQPETEEMRWGILLEPAIRQRYGEVTGRLIRQANFVRSAQHEWLFCNPDGVADDRLLEIKTARTAEGWGEPDSDEIPQHYLVQVHHNLIATVLPLADVAVLIGGQDFRIYTIEPDPAIHSELIQREAEFWDRVQRRDPPAPVSLADAQARWGRISTKGHVVAAPEQVAAIERLRARQEAMRAAERAQEADKTVIAKAIGDAGDTLVDAAGNVLATWKLNKGTAGYTVEPKSPARKLLIKGKKE